MKNSKGKTLDLACGSGRFLNYADWGIDASLEMIQVAQSKFPSKTIIHAEAEKTSLLDHSVQNIITFHFFMHLNKEKIKNILKECDRILEQNGRVIFDIPSTKRRNLLGFKRKNWHGGFSLTLKEINNLHSNFKINRTFGILFFPIHRFPTTFRNACSSLDYKISNSFLKEYSSYLIVELVKK